MLFLVAVVMLLDRSFLNSKIGGIHPAVRLSQLLELSDTVYVEVRVTDAGSSGFEQPTGF